MPIREFKGTPVFVIENERELVAVRQGRFRSIGLEPFEMDVRDRRFRIGDSIRIRKKGTTYGQSDESTG